MTKEKLQSLEKYKNELVFKLSLPIPRKHTNHPITYTNFLKNELSFVTKQIDEAKLRGAEK